MIELVAEPIDLNRVVAAVSTPAAGATVLFLGTTRRENEGRTVLRLEYEAYSEMAVAEIQRIVSSAERQWQCSKIAVVHRVGEVPLTEVSVAIAVSAPHRAEAFAACRYVIDELKKTVPIWKKELFEGGELWIGTQQSPSARASSAEPTST